MDADRRWIYPYIVLAIVVLAILLFG